MFGKIAADALGLSDIGRVIKPADFGKVDSDDYIFQEDGEKIYFLIKSKSDEYCFTNRGLIHLDGASAVSKKRMLKRYDYYKHTIANVRLETAGTVDLDVEIKFTCGNETFSIDVHKQDLEQVKDLYKSLIKISEVCAENEATHEYARQSLEVATRAVAANRTEGDVVEQFKGINQFAFDWLSNAKSQYKIKEFGYIFEKYINN